MDDDEPSILIPVNYEKIADQQAKRVKLTRFKDDSVYLEGDEEVIFECADQVIPWKAAIKYLHDCGYKKESTKNCD